MKICTKCNKSLPLSSFGKDKGRKDGLYPQCKECKNADQRDKYHSSEELRRSKYQKTKQCFSDDPDAHQEQLERQREWYREHYQNPEFREREYERNKKYQKKKAKKRWLKIKSDPIRQEQYNVEHKEYVKDRYRNDPEFKKRNRDYYARRRAIKRANGGSYTLKEWNSLCDLARNRCLSCGKKRKLEVDHILPVSLGGTSNIENIQPLCKSCNASKGTDTIDYRTPIILEWLSTLESE